MEPTEDCGKRAYNKQTRMTVLGSVKFYVEKYYMLRS